MRMYVVSLDVCLYVRVCVWLSVCVSSGPSLRLKTLLQRTCVDIDPGLCMYVSLYMGVVVYNLYVLQVYTHIYHI